MALKSVCVILLLAWSCQAATGASILALFSSLSYSDHLVFRGYISRLVQRGHSAVVMTPYPGNFQHPEVERIVEVDVSEDSAPLWNEYMALMTNTDYFPKLKAQNEFALKLAIAQLKSKQMTAMFINPNIKFDLVITEADVPLLYAVADKYKAPHVSITTTSGRLHQHEAKGNPIHPTYYPDVSTLNYRNLTRWQKLVEFYRHVQTKRDFYNDYLPLSEVAAKKILGLNRDLQEVEYDIDLLLVACNPALSGNRPTVPAVIYADRMHLTPALSLPQNLQTYLDSATKGVVYFSLGAIQESEQLAPRLLNTLSDAFRELPYAVLWKIGNTTMINKGDNVLAQAWFPQQQVLAHPNVKAFITSGGARSIEEALFYEVPIVGLPLIKSRAVFMKEITKYGAGEILDPYYLEKDTLKTTITNVVNNDQYKKAISKLKDMVVDPVISGPENAVWWTEYVLRNGGARHFRSPAVGLTFVQYYMLDLLSYFLAVLTFVLYLTFVILRYIVRRLCLRFSGRSVVPQSRKFKAL